MIERLAREAAIIVFHCYALSPGVSIELELLRCCHREDSTVIVLKDVDSSEEYSGIEDLAIYANVIDYEVPRKNHPALVGFSRIAYESELDWNQPEKSNFLGDLLQTVLRQEADAFTRFPEITGVPPEDRMASLNDRARALRLNGHFEDAAAAAAEALAIAKRLGDPDNIAAVHISVGIVALEMGRLQVALEAFHDSGTMFQSLGDKDGRRPLRPGRDASSRMPATLRAPSTCSYLPSNSRRSSTLMRTWPTPCGKWRRCLIKSAPN